MITRVEINHAGKSEKVLRLPLPERVLANIDFVIARPGDWFLERHFTLANLAFEHLNGMKRISIQRNAAGAEHIIFESSVDIPQGDRDDIVRVIQKLFPIFNAQALIDELAPSPEEMAGRKDELSTFLEEYINNTFREFINEKTGHDSGITFVRIAGKPEAPSVSISLSNQCKTCSSSVLTTIRVLSESIELLFTEAQMRYGGLNIIPDRSTGGPLFTFRSGTPDTAIPKLEHP